MITLAMDTSTERASVAVVRDGVVLAERTLDAPRTQTEELIPLIDETLATAHINVRDVNEVVVGVGPGPFTGLRVGIVTGVMLAAGLEVPVHGVLSLDACAVVLMESNPGDEPFVVTIDAKRGEVFWARYDAEGARLEGPFVGANIVGHRVYPSAAALATVSERVAPRPIYVREPDVMAPHAPKKVRG